MNNTLQYNRTQTIIAVIYLLLMVTVGCMCAYKIVHHAASCDKVVAPAATTQWSTDTSWVGGW